MNPSKFIEVPGVEVHAIEVESTRWHDFASKEPGQPGVFEVDPLQLDDGGEELRRFSFFNGKDFGPVMQTPSDAHEARFGRRIAPVTKFRGLVEAA